VIPARFNAMVPAVNLALVNVVLTLFVAVTTPEEPLSEPLPVQPLTVKVCLPPVSVRLAVLIPLKVKDIVPALSAELARGDPAVLLATTVPVPDGAVNRPLPVQPLTLKELAVPWPAIIRPMVPLSWILAPLKASAAAKVTAVLVMVKSSVLKPAPDSPL